MTHRKEHLLRVLLFGVAELLYSDNFQENSPHSINVSLRQHLVKTRQHSATPKMIYLGGGGSEVDEARIWDLAYKPGQRVVVWPFAMPAARWEGTMQWITASLTSRGEFASISLGLEGPDFGLDHADIVAIPGGNTFRLLHYLQKNGLLLALRQFLRKGGHI